MANIFLLPLLKLSIVASKALRRRLSSMGARLSHALLNFGELGSICAFGNQQEKEQGVFPNLGKRLGQ